MAQEGLSPQKSTTVRSYSGRWSRSLLQIASTLSPTWVERYATRRFFTPQTKRDRPAPRVPEAEATATVLPIGPHRLATWRWGEGPLVLLVHGWNGHAGQLTPFVRPLLNLGRSVMAFDLPAHGRSAGSQSSLPEIAQALVALAQAVGPLDAVIAHSLGGSATAIAMSRGLEAKRAVLLAPAAEPTHFARLFARQLGLPKERVEGMLRQMERFTGVDLASLALPGLVGALRQPALLLHDPADPVVPFAHGEAIASAWPGAELQPVTGAGHFRILRDSAVVERVKAFFA